MREGFKKSHINMASRIMSFFMQAIWARQAFIARSVHTQTIFHNCTDGRRLPKGFKNHNPAGSKIAKLALEQRCTLRHE